VAAELAALQVQSKGERKHIAELTAEKGTLSVKLRDRDEELHGKAKLLEVVLLLILWYRRELTSVEDVHDETVSLTLQLNMAEKQNAELQVENKELVDRWMARMSQEAEAMNTASRFS
jgi:DNA repair exonuclease SbcCD ATPase subunit